MRREQPALERQLRQLVEQVVGVRRRDRAVRPRGSARRAPGCPRPARRRGRPPARAGLAGLAGVDRAEQVDPPVVVLARPARQLADQRLGSLRHPAQAGLDLAAIGERVQPLGAGLAARPGAWAPRSSRTVIRARSSGPSSSRSASVWWYFRVRRPVAAHTIRISSRCFSRARRLLDQLLVVVRRRGRGCWSGCRRCAGR